MLGRVPIRREHSGSAGEDRAQKVAQDTAQRVNAHPLQGAKLLDAETGAAAATGLSFTAATARSLAHGLGRKAKGFIEVGAVDVATVARVGLYATAMPSGLTSATHITVTATSTGKCFVLVF